MWNEGREIKFLIHTSHLQGFSPIDDVGTRKEESKSFQGILSCPCPQEGERNETVSFSQVGRILKQEKDVLEIKPQEKKIFQWVLAVPHGSEFVWRKFSCYSPEKPCVAIYLTLGALVCHWVMTDSSFAYGVWYLSVQFPKTWELGTAVKDKSEERAKSFPTGIQHITWIPKATIWVPSFIDKKIKELKNASDRNFRLSHWHFRERERKGKRKRMLGTINPRPLGFLCLLDWTEQNTCACRRSCSCSEQEIYNWKLLRAEHGY